MFNSKKKIIRVRHHRTFKEHWICCQNIRKIKRSKDGGSIICYYSEQILPRRVCESPEAITKAINETVEEK